MSEKRGGREELGKERKSREMSEKRGDREELGK